MSTGTNPNRTRSREIWPGEIVSAARFMKMKLLPQMRPSTTNAAVAVLRMTALRRLLRGDHQVVEDRRRKARLEQSAVDLLQAEVAAVGVLDPRHREVLVAGARFERAVEP